MRAMVELVLNMKNASTTVPASNILFNLESEKVSDSAVFTTESGTASMVVDSLAQAQTRDPAKFTAMQVWISAPVTLQ